MKNIYFFFCFTLLTTSTVFGQTETKPCKTTSTLISGTYHGKNLYFQTTIPNSIQKISLNEKEMATVFLAKAFELDLSELKQDQAYSIKIYYCENTETPYKILNPEAVK